MDDTRREWGDASSPATLEALAGSLGEAIGRLIRDALDAAYEAGRLDERREMAGRLEAAIWARGAVPAATGPSAPQRPRSPVNARERPRPSARQAIMGLLAQADGPVAIASVRQAVLDVGWKHSAFNKMRSKLLSANLIRSDAGCYVLTEAGKRWLQHEAGSLGGNESTEEEEMTEM